jgi:hypothetical protein
MAAWIRMTMWALALAIPAAAMAQSAPETARERIDLKTLGLSAHLATAQRCHGRYRIVTADGTARDFAEGDVHLKTDGGALGPAPGVPVFVPAGAWRDHADLIFAAPEEIGGFVKSCP